MKQSRDNWIDNIKIFACVLVALGHFFQSMCTAGILEDGPIFQWFIRTIYYFHVPLFFICSGYVYQKYSQIDSFSTWKRHVLKKLLALGVPYFVFSMVTWGMKKIFSGDVNTAVHSLGYDLFVHPLSPYWYLFAIFFVFVITRTFSNKKSCLLGFAVAMLLRILSNMVDCYAVKIIMSNQIWFVIGMMACVFDFTALAERYKVWAYLAIALFVLLSFVEWESAALVMGILACGALLLLFARTNRKNGAWVEYTMPIFLMHTIFAAGIRAVLLRLGITAPAVHIVLGIAASFGLPIVAAEVMKKLKLDIFYQPGKYIKLKK